MSILSQCRRILGLINDLSSPYGVTVSEVRNKYAISRQVFINDKKLIEDIFHPEIISMEPISGEKGYRYFIKKDGSILKNTFFTQEEEYLILSLLKKENHDSYNAIRKKLFMFSKYEVMRLCSSLTHVESILYAIKNDKVLHIIRYEAPSQNTISDYQVEAIELFDHNRRLYAYDLEDKKCKFFKLDRINSLSVSDKLCVNQNLYETKFHDAFGWSCAKSDTLEVGFEMTRLAGNMIIENYPDTKKYRELTGDSNFPYRFKGKVAEYKGVGRFVMGLPGHIRNIESQRFLEYLKNQKQQYLF